MFNSAKRNQDETAVLFASRLKSLLKYYLKSRKVSTFDKLSSLIVSDRIKSTLADDCLNHVLSVEATVDDGWLACDRLCDVIDTFYANRTKGRPNASAIGSVSKSVRAADDVNVESRMIGVASRVGTVETVMNNHTRRGKGVRPVEAPKTPGKVCWQCGGAYLRRQCPQLSRTSDRSSGRGAGPPHGRPPHGPGRTVQVSQAVISTAAAELAVDCEPQVQVTQCVVAGSVSREWAAQGMGLDGGRHGAEFEDGIVEAGRESIGKLQLAREVAA
jgi:hypothetical protein